MEAVRQMDETDLQAIADLTKEYIGTHIKPVIHLKDVRRGHCYATGYISIPTWTLSQGEAFTTYYVVHEVCHLRYPGHTPLFKTLEKAALKQWDLVPTYKKAYPRTLTRSNGQIAYEDPRKPRQPRNSQIFIINGTSINPSTMQPWTAKEFIAARRNLLITDRPDTTPRREERE